MNGAGGAFDTGKPIVALDIDGTLGDYHRHFLRFASEWIGRPMPSPGDINPGLPLSRFMGVSKSTYRQCKLAYRQGGLKRSMPVYDGASELSRVLRKMGAEVWICTTRPYLRLDNIDPDTRHWLRRSKIQYDAVIWGENKYRDLVRSVGVHRVVAVMDDLPELAQQASSLGIGNVYLRGQPYNTHVDTGRRARREGAPTRVEGCSQAQFYIEQDIRTWRKNQQQATTGQALILKG